MARPTKGIRKLGKSKDTALAPVFKPGFATRLDQRTELARLLRDRFCEIATDLGGESSLSRIQRGLLERMLFCEVLLENLEESMATGGPEKAAVAGQWISASGTYLRIASTLGLERKASSNPWTLEAQAK